MLVGLSGTSFAQSTDGEDDEYKSGILVATTNSVLYEVPYFITSGTVDEITPMCDTASTLVLFTSDKPGRLTLNIPRNLLDSNQDGMNADFFVLLDGEEKEFEETGKAYSREIIISFEPGSHDLEIITTWAMSVDIEGFACKAVHNPPYSYILSPLRQFESGSLYHETICKSGMQLTQKHDGSPACVTHETKLKLMERGWAEISDDVVSERTAHPEPPLTPTQCRPGLPPFTSDFYLDNESCKWKIIPEPIIDEVVPYVWNAYLQKNQIDFSPQERSYINTDEGYFIQKETRVCSPLTTSNGTEFYISSTFTIEPFEITDTIMSETQPDDCHKIWKINRLLVEPPPELGAWLENYWKNENEG